MILVMHVTDRPDRVAQLAEHWASIPKVVARFGYTLRVTSQA